MATAPKNALSPRKSPQQRRSSITVDAIQEATIQVLMRKGPDRLTTVLVATEAGVSVGTLYQYFPNKQSLLFTALEKHLADVVLAVEQTCRANQFQDLDTMLRELVSSFMGAKLRDRRISVSLYRIAGLVGGDLIAERFRVRCQRAIAAMLQTGTYKRFTDVNFVSQMIFLALAGTLRGFLEDSAPSKSSHKVKQHLTQMMQGYCKAVLTDDTNDLDVGIGTSTRLPNHRQSRGRSESRVRFASTHEPAPDSSI